jgi:hypothetical protein
MSVATQISGNIRPNNKAMHSFIHMLTHIGIDVTHPIRDESFFYNTNTSNAWHYYNQEIDFYESIAGSAFHVIYNDELIDEEVSMQILYAMLKQRPIVMAGAPHFSESVHPFTKGLITRNMPLFHSADLPELELTELSHLLSQLKPTEYKLQNSEKILVHANIQKHFRALLDQAKSQ